MGIYFLLLTVGFCWGQYNPHTFSKRTSIVHLFEWRWEDVALECERCLAPNGFGGVQISPPNENVIVTDPKQPWWERYQPVSYKLYTRSGNETEFRDMVTRCNNVGVYIYVDAVINHMCGANAGAGNHATCGNYFNAKTEDFPAVPYSGSDFNDDKCKSKSGDIENYHDISQVRDCRLVSLLDLALEKDYVRSKVAEYMNHLIDVGVAGFRIDAAKHMWPGDVKAVLDKLKDLNTKWFPEGTKPFIYQEVIDLGGEPIKGSEYFGNGRVTEFKYGAKLGTVIRKWDGEKMAYLKNWGEGWGFVPSDRALVFVDNHDNQRGHGAGGSAILTFWDARLYKMAVGFMLAHPYGFTRVMSSFRWPRYFVNGKTLCSGLAVPSSEVGYVTEHGQSAKSELIEMRELVNLGMWSKADSFKNCIAVFHAQMRWSLNVTLQTGLPTGTYCDVISGQKKGDHCTAVEVHVAADGMANFLVGNEDEDAFIAIHVDAKL
ncbi:AMY1 amylase, partial [Mionectes macconnelli]|nr:AMY1 amylase [Mionectes macconnelli]